MNYTKLLFILFLVLPFKSFSWDTPGYLGKKTTIGIYTFYMSDYWAKSQSLDTRDFQFNKKSFTAPTLLYGLQISKAITNKMEFSFQAQFLRYGIVAQTELSVNKRKLENGNLAKFSKASGVNYKFIARFYKDYVPPLGNYYGLGVSFLNQRLSMVDSLNNTNLMQKVYDLGLCYELGMRRHIGYNIILDYGLEGTFYLNGKLNVQDRLDNDFTEDSINNNKRTYARRNLINFKLGLNYIF